MPKVSALVHTFNEENNIRACLECLKWADEIVVVDMYSDDKTIEVAREYTDKIFYFERMGYVEPARNFGITQTTGDWILVVDADERVTISLKQKLLDIVSEDSADVVEIPRKNYILGEWIHYTKWYPDYQMRFFRKGAISYSDKVHGGTNITGRKFTLAANDEANCLIHFNYTDCAQFVEKMNRYTTFEVEKLRLKGEQFTIAKMLRRSFYEFKSRYISNKGYKDGIRGLILSVLMGFYNFLMYAKYWEDIEFKDRKVQQVYEEIDKELIKTHNNMG